jgi:cytochrome b6-f complex iron-sulfur subunit
MSEVVNKPDGNPSRPSVFTSRREFVKIGVLALAAAWLGMFVQSKLFPSATVQTAKPVVFPLSEVPVGGYKDLTYSGVPAIVLRSTVSIRCLSRVCTHMGCIVKWYPGQKEFICPCHNGRFDQFGDVVGGPPPLPLPQFPVKVEGDKIVVGESA